MSSFSFADQKIRGKVKALIFFNNDFILWYCSKKITLRFGSRSV